MAFGIRVDATARTEIRTAGILLEVEREAPGRGEILDAIEAPIALRRVEKLAIPVRLGMIVAVAARADRGQRRIRTPSDVAPLTALSRLQTGFSRCSA